MSAEMDKYVNELLKKMTIEEKVGQMTQVTLDVVLKGNVYEPDRPFAFDEDKLVDVLLNKHVGSILNVPTSEALTRDQWFYVVSTIQEKALKKSRLRIPVLYGIDSIHGASYTRGATFFPHQIGLAATWNLELAEEQGAITAYETRASSIPWIFSPVQDIARNPVWSRIYETFGEDPYLSGEMGAAMIKGIEGDDISRFDKTASCMKHFLGYGMPWSGKDRTPIWIPEHYLREYFLPSFKAAMEAGSKTIMINSGEINGVPVHANKNILTTLLRDELGFEGLAVTDWEDIKYLHSRHRVAASHKEAVRMAIDAGVDMSMVPDDLSFCEHLIELVKEGTISEERLDISVRRILKLKLELGLFDNPILPSGAKYDKFGSKEFKEKAKSAAAESITLLKNENHILPLSTDKKILVTGWAAESMPSLNGGWSYDWQGATSVEFAKDKMNLRQAIEQEVGKENVTYVEGCQYDVRTNLEEAVEKAQTVDHIILCLGENSYTEFLGNINDLDLPKEQIALAQAMINTGKPITLVLLEGRPRVISDIADDIESILLGYYPGQEGASSITEIIFGKTNPSGKLPYTYPRYSNALMTYDYKHAESVELQGSEIPFNPQFEFGFGLSYTQFEYSDLKIVKPVLTENDDIEISFTLKNIGDRTGKEVAQVYIGDDYASITPSVKRLRAFRKVELEPGEEQKLNFAIPMKSLAFVNIENNWVLEKGTFKLYVADMMVELELS